MSIVSNLLRKNLKVNLKKIGTHVVVFFGFGVVSLTYYSPLLQGKVLMQSDINQYRGMSRQIEEHREKYNEETYWIDNAFVGMPTYQLGAKYPADVLQPAYKLLRVFPRPAHNLFLYLISMYVLLMVLKINWRYAIIGSLAFGFSTYLLIILQVGHNTKALALGFIPLVIAGIILLFKQKKLCGFLLTTLALAFQVRSNHYQMTYYLLLLIGLIILVYVIDLIRQKEFRNLLTSIALILISGILALGFNTTSLLATAEYTSFSTRGKSDLKIDQDGAVSTSNGLDYDYITEYSYGLFETFNLIAPRIQGGASYEQLDQNSHFYSYLVKSGIPVRDANQIIKQVPTYWGDQPILEAPAYIGASVFFLAILGLFFVRNNIRVWLLSGIFFSIVLSWGKNFPWLTNFFIEYVPFYNKFRAVSSIQIILEFCLPVLAILGLYHYSQSKKKTQIKYLFRTIIVFVSVILILLLTKQLHDFSGLNDSFYQQNYGTEFIQSLIADRKVFFHEDLVRALLYGVSVGVLLWFMTLKRLPEKYAIPLIGIIIVTDLLTVNNRYIETDYFVSKSQAENTFQLTDIDRQILTDTTRFRVYNNASGLVGARDAYFHRSVGGYHAAKPKRLQNLFDYGLFNANPDILSMLNVKYLIARDPQSGSIEKNQNSDSFGVAWYVDSLRLVSNYDQLLDELKNNKLRNVAFLLDLPQNQDLQQNFKMDSLAKIELIDSRANYLKYSSSSNHDGFAVFSEMYYPKGWYLTINQKPAKIHTVNYLLRGAIIPKGENIIEFKFTPNVVKLGTNLTYTALTIFILFSIYLSILHYMKNRINNIVGGSSS